ncbi:response regulator [Limnoglobus roseus]|uniref:response regulator n=1 Tax=Limnoglobus roseus TaxID=2598579 RepID=UPI0011EB6B53|nr:response regulator [Limnoglobus roseus]
MRVLIVDDNRDAADSLATLLGLWGHAAEVAYDGRAGYAAAVARPPDCVVSDIAMPGVDGYELAALVRATPSLRRARLVALTAYSDADRAAKVAAAGFSHHLTKPVDLNRLREVLSVLDRIENAAERAAALAERNAALAAQTHELAQRNVELAGATKDLIQEVQVEVRDLKDEVVDLKAQVTDLVQKQHGDQPPAGE